MFDFPVPPNFPFHFQTTGRRAVKLTAEQVRQIFIKCDKDCNGVLSWDELKDAFHRLGAVSHAFRAHRGLHHADANGDGQIASKELDNLVKYAYSLGYTINEDHNIN